jgi:DNA-directed RNA polymerase specialized sigma24 family protein
VTEEEFVAAVSRLRCTPDTLQEVAALAWERRHEVEFPSRAWLRGFLAEARSRSGRFRGAGREMRENLAAILDRIPPGHRQLAEILCLEPITISAAGRRLGLTSSTAHAKWRRLRRFAAHISGGDIITVNIAGLRIPVLLDDSRKHRAVFTDCLGDSVTTLYEAGFSYRGIARDLGLDREAVRSLLSAHIVRRHAWSSGRWAVARCQGYGRRKPWTALEFGMAAELDAIGLSILDIAIVLGRNESSVRYKLKLWKSKT